MISAIEAGLTCFSCLNVAGPGVMAQRVKPLYAGVGTCVWISRTHVKLDGTMQGSPGQLSGYLGWLTQWQQEILKQAEKARTNASHCSRAFRWRSAARQRSHRPCTHPYPRTHPEREGSGQEGREGEKKSMRGTRKIPGVHPLSLRQWGFGKKKTRNSKQEKVLWAWGIVEVPTKARISLQRGRRGDAVWGRGQ